MKVKCKNCGDMTNMPSNADFERDTLQWCVPCFQQRKTHCKVNPETCYEHWTTGKKDSLFRPRSHSYEK